MLILFYEHISIYVDLIDANGDHSWLFFYWEMYDFQVTYILKYVIVSQIQIRLLILKTKIPIKSFILDFHKFNRL